MIRAVPAVGGLAAFLAAEAVRPFRAPVESKLRHVLRNFAIAGSNAVVVNLVFGGLLLAWADHATTAGWGLFSQLPLGFAGNVLTSVVVLDLIFYGAHWANHRVPVLWRFHRAHHSDVDFDTTTALRFHLGEVLWSTGIKAACVVVLGVSPWGLVAFETMLGLAAQWQHSNLRLPDRWDAALRLAIVTPNMHRIHHSRVPDEHNANYGTIFSWWDRLAGTYHLDVDQSGITIGLAEYPTPTEAAFACFWLMPLGRGCRSVPSTGTSS
jgi:sterol desaturase/sphingolipid hydroxylase (fatty acid hydroxylase superfamily)